jgi:hypothetical protein
VGHLRRRLVRSGQDDRRPPDAPMPTAATATATNTFTLAGT